MAGPTSPSAPEDLGAPAVALQRQQAFLVEDSANGFLILAVDHQLDTGLQEGRADLFLLQRQGALLACDIGDVHQFGNAFLDAGQAKFESPCGDLEGAYELAKAELGHDHEETTHHDDQQGGHIEENLAGGSQQDGGDNDRQGADKADECG